MFGSPHDDKISTSHVEQFKRILISEVIVISLIWTRPTSSEPDKTAGAPRLKTLRGDTPEDVSLHAHRLSELLARSRNSIELGNGGKSGPRGNSSRAVHNRQDIEDSAIALRADAPSPHSGLFMPGWVYCPKPKRGPAMNSASRFLTAFFSVCVCTFIAGPSFGEIDIGVLSKGKAKEKYGITMHARKNGDAGIKVWLQFKMKGWLEKFTYAELRMVGGRGKHLISAQLQSNPVHHRQPKDTTTVAFSADADHLSQCSFLVVCYGSNEGDVGYYLRVKDFLDLANPVTEE
jgi:hypothetical protein